MNGPTGNIEKKEESIPFLPPEPNPFWKKNAEKFVGDFIPRLEDNAKQIITLTGALLGIYFNAIKFSDIKSGSVYSTFIYVAPLVIWLISLCFILYSIFGTVPTININSSNSAKQQFEKITRFKYRLISLSIIFLVFSFITLIIAFLHYLGAF